MNAAKNDRPTVLAVCGHFAQLIRITIQIGVLNDFVLLIMVPQDEQPISQLFFGSQNSSVEFVVSKLAVGREREWFESDTHGTIESE
jgi:hypothetical protein